MKSHETDLSAFKDTPPAQVRLPSPHENHLRAQSDQPPPQSRQKTPRRLSFSKQDRLLKRYEFKRLSRYGHRWVGSRVCVDMLPAPSLRLGITVPAKFGSAPKRNRFKRLVREIFRLNRDSFPEDREINVFPRQFAKWAKLEEIREELFAAFAQKTTFPTSPSSKTAPPSKTKKTKAKSMAEAC